MVRVRLRRWKSETHTGSECLVTANRAVGPFRRHPRLRQGTQTVKMGLTTHRALFLALSADIASILRRTSLFGGGAWRENTPSLLATVYIY